MVTPHIEGEGLGLVTQNISSVSLNTPPVNSTPKVRAVSTRYAVISRDADRQTHGHIKRLRASHPLEPVGVTRISVKRCVVFSTVGFFPSSHVSRFTRFRVRMFPGSHVSKVAR